MTPESEKLAAELLADALEVPDAERGAFLRMRCGADEALRARVETLLGAYAWGEAHLRSTGLGAPVEGVAGRLVAGRVGMRVGPFRISHVVAAGGMGVVYRAERCEGDFEQQVAVKFLHAGFGSREVLQRFRSERQLLARLHHPNIARLIDGGATPDGEPYLVMEYVDGVPLDRYCDDRRLTVRERLRLFCTVCDAVQHAHQNLVVHRDLKPGNIFIDADGQVRLLDFGIAKVMDPEHRPADVTATAQRAMTPRYASPEQLRGEDITTASDVYSLGVVLYELLTGRSPYRTERAWSAEFVRAVCEEEPAAPSVAVARSPEATGTTRGTTLRKLAKALSGDLDTIVLRALGKELQRRYGSAEELASDLRRHLSGMPVGARPDTLGYRLTKFARRNPALVVAVAVAFASLAVGLIVSTTQYRGAVRAQERERRERAQAEWLAYAGSISAAESAIRTNRLLEARRQLDLAPIELRGWEWRHLASRLDRSRLSIPAHQAAVTGVRFTPDGSRIVSASEDRTIGVWDARTGASLARFGPLEAVARSLAVDASGARVAVGLHMGGVRVLDLADGHVVLSLEDPVPGADQLPPPSDSDPQILLLDRASTWSTVDIDPRSNLLAIGYYSGLVQVWDLGSHRRIAEWKLDFGWVKTTVRLRPGGRQLAIGQEFAPPELRDTATGRLIRKFGRGPGTVELSFDPSGRNLAATTQDGLIEAWEVDSGRLVGKLGGHRGSVRALEFDAAGEVLVSGATDQRVIATDVRTGGMRWVYPGHTSSVHCLSRSPDGSHLATGDGDGLIKVWDFATEDVRTLEMAEIEYAFRRHWAQHACLSPDGRLMVTSAFQVWDLGRGSRLTKVRSLDQALAIAWLGRGERVVAGLPLGLIAVLDPGTGWSKKTFQGHAGDVRAIDVHPGLPRFVTGSRDSTLRMWDVESEQPILTMRGHESAVFAVRMDPKGRWIASGSEDGAIRLWDAQQGHPRHVLLGHQGAVRGLAFSADGALLASASFDGTVRLWDPVAGVAMGTLFESTRPLYAVAFTRDGSRLAAGGIDGVVHLLDPAVRREAARLHGHDERIFWLGFAPGDAALLSSSLDGTIRVWDVATAGAGATAPGP